MKIAISETAFFGTKKALFAAEKAFFFWEHFSSIVIRTRISYVGPSLAEIRFHDPETPAKLAVFTASKK